MGSGLTQIDCLRQSRGSRLENGYLSPLASRTEFGRLVVRPHGPSRPWSVVCGPSTSARKKAALQRQPSLYFVCSSLTSPLQTQRQSPFHHLLVGRYQLVRFVVADHRRLVV